MNSIIKRRNHSVVAWLPLVCASCVLLFLVVANFTALNGLVRDRRDDDGEECSEITVKMKGPLQPMDSSLIELIRQKYLHPPSSSPYSLRHDLITHSNYKTLYPAWILINGILKDLYSSNRGRFFVEAGAFDGEYLSNSLRLEMELGWTGLLVEPDKDNFDLLLKTNRKAWLSPTCFSTHSYPEAVTMRKWRELDQNVNWLTRAASNLITNENSVDNDLIPDFGTLYQPAQCLPAQSLLWALNVTHVDFFSLDIEMVEVAVLENFPFDQITVDVWAIEHRRLDVQPRQESKDLINITLSYMKRMKFPENVVHYRETLISEFEDQEFIKFMVDKGYYYLDMSCAYVGDYIFIRKASDLFAMLNVPQDQQNRTSICQDKPVHSSSGIAIDTERIRDPHHYPNIQYKYIKQ